MAGAPVAYASLAESAAEYLDPDEEIVVLDGYPAVDFWKGRRGIQKQPTPAGVTFVRRQMGVVITTRRFLMFEMHGFPAARAHSLLMDLPVSRIDSIGCASHWWKSSEAKLTIDGVRYDFIVAHAGRCRRLATSLETAKRGAAT